MSHPPTVEQQSIIDAFGAGKSLVIEAGAGAGKTTSLRMLSQTGGRRRGIYVAYSRALADDAHRAGFPPTVTCKTAHSLAYGPVDSRYKHRLNGPRIPAQETARILGIREPIRITQDLAPLAPQQIARIVMDAVGRFCNSADELPDRWHIAPLNGIDRPDMDALRRTLVPLARKAWEDIISPTGRLRFTHDCYLKIFQLGDPRLECDYLLLDEAQDASPVMASIFDRQADAQRIMVGDSAQAIFGWRGAVDAMAKFQADARLTLSQSFRFGDAIAAEANKWLTLLGANLRLRGFNRVPSRLDVLDEPDAVLCRTNAEAIGQLMAAAGTGRRAALVGGGDDIRRLAEAAITLQAGQGTAHPELFMFRTWNEVREYTDQDSSGSDLRVFVKLIDTHSAATVLGIVDQLVPEDRADVIVSTAHRGKGREWGAVRIADDFREPKPDPKSPGVEPVVERDEAMLAYVAVTRAKVVLDRSGLAWVDRFAPAAGWPAIPGSPYDDDEPWPTPVPAPAGPVEEEPEAPAPTVPSEPYDARLAEHVGDLWLTVHCLRCAEHWSACTCHLMPDRRWDTTPGTVTAQAERALAGRA
jgi:hypothetical protein